LVPISVPFHQPESPTQALARTPQGTCPRASSAVAEPRAARLGQERVNVGLLDRVALVVSLAWIAQSSPPCSSATTSIPASAAQACGQSDQSQTLRNRPRYSGAFRRYQAQIRSNWRPLTLGSESRLIRSAKATTVAARVRPLNISLARIESSWRDTAWAMSEKSQLPCRPHSEHSSTKEDRVDFVDSEDRGF
jgi:hypothetical protein